MSAPETHGGHQTATERTVVAVLIGMGSPAGMDCHMWDSPTDNVEVLIVHYPMEVDRRYDDGSEEYKPVTITGEDELRAWAGAEFDHYDIRVL